jgi:hypothetical protein
MLGEIRMVFKYFEIAIVFMTIPVEIIRMLIVDDLFSLVPIC